MHKAILTAIVVAALPIVAHAQTYRAINHLNVVPLGGASFEVIESRGEGPRGIWCAAADYAIHRLGATGRIYIRAGRGPARSFAGSKSVVFTTDPATLPREPFKSYSLSTSQVGVGLPVQHAIEFCRTYDIERDLR